MFINYLKLELYLKISDHIDSIKLCTFRCRNHFLPVTKSIDSKKLIKMNCYAFYVPLKKLEMNSTIYQSALHTYTYTHPFFNNLRKKLLSITTVKNTNAFYSRQIN